MSGILEKYTTMMQLKRYSLNTRKREIYDLPGPEKEHKLPSVLSEEEIIKLFKQVSNIKHKAILKKGVDKIVNPLDNLTKTGEL